ncbi:MAG: DnaD domain protein, partial [Eubacterium sp.]
AYIRKTRDQQKLYYAVFGYLGLKRNPIAWEKEMMDRWITDFGYDMEIITLALSRSEKPAIRYINAILKRWHDNGYTTTAQIEAEPKNPPRDQHSMPPADSDRDQAYEDLQNEQAQWLRSLYDDEQ